MPSYEETAGEIYEVAGPDVVTYADVMRRYGRLVGKRPLIIPVPVLSPRLSSYWLRLVTAVPTNIASENRLAQLIPQKLLNFDESAIRALTAERQHAVPARWVESSAAVRTFRPEYSFYSKQAHGEYVTTSRPEDLWAVISRKR